MATRSGYLFKRGETWWLEYKIGGRRVRKSLGTKSETKAKEKRDAELGLINARSDREAAAVLKARIEELEEQEWTPVSDAWARYLSSPLRPRKGGADSTRANYENQWRRFTKWLGREHPEVGHLEQVTKKIAGEYLTDLGQARAQYSDKIVGVSNSTYNQHLGSLKRVYDVLEIAPGPFAKFPRRSKQSEGRRALTVAELKTVCGEADGEMRVLFALGIYTGMRLGDCATLQWAEVDLDRGIILRRPMKTRHTTPDKMVEVPVHPYLMGILSETPKAQRRGYVLPGIAADYERRVSDVSRAIQNHFEACGIETQRDRTQGRMRRSVEVGFHSLRHSFVSLSREAGTALSVVEALVGHSNPEMTRLYSHTSEDAMAKAVASLPSMEPKKKASKGRR